MIKGSSHSDERGVLTFNNGFDAAAVKRIYTIENQNTEFVRGWQGHQVEQRWFACMTGRMEIRVIVLDRVEKPSAGLKQEIFVLNSNTLDFLHVPAGCITAITALDPQSKLLVMSDYAVGEIGDELRYALDYFN